MIPSLGNASPNVTGVEGATPTTMTSPPPTPHLVGTLDGIAQQLSMAPDALRSSLAAGASITDLAAQKGVSGSNLVKSVESQIQQSRKDRGLAPLDATVLDRMVNRAFNRHRGHHGHRVTSTPAPNTASPTLTPSEPANVQGQSTAGGFGLLA